MLYNKELCGPRPLTTIILAYQQLRQTYGTHDHFSPQNDNKFFFAIFSMIDPKDFL